MARPGVRHVPEGSGEQGKMEKTGSKIICGAPTTLAVKALVMIDDDDESAGFHTLDQNCRSTKNETYDTSNTVNTNTMWGLMVILNLAVSSIISIISTDIYIYYIF